MSPCKHIHRDKEISSVTVKFSKSFPNISTIFYYEMCAFLGEKKSYPTTNAQTSGYQYTIKMIDLQLKNKTSGEVNCPRIRLEH